MAFLCNVRGKNSCNSIGGTIKQMDKYSCPWSLDKYCPQILYSSLPILKYLVSSCFGFPQQIIESKHLEKKLEKSSVLP